MTADLGLGLSPTRVNLRAAMARQEMEIDKDFESVLDALEYIKLARSETSRAAAESKTFTFAHRRFQEYFATSILLKEPNRITPPKLLADARWRETAVVMCQSQPLGVLFALINEAQELLQGIVQEAPELDRAIDDVGFAETAGSLSAGDSEILDFHLAPRAIHILGLLQDGFGGRLNDLPESLREKAGILIRLATVHGTLYERKWALQVAGIVPKSLLLSLLRRAFSSDSQWLKDTAYRQTARLGEIPPDIASAIRSALVGLSLAGRLNRERLATNAHLSRFDKSSYFLSILRLLVWIPFLDFLSVALLFIALFSVLVRGQSAPFITGLLFLGVGLASYVVFKLPALVAFLLGITKGTEFLIGYSRFLVLGVMVTSFSKRLASEIGMHPIAMIELIIPFILVLWGPMAWAHAREGRLIHHLY
jgi:hypothetical protein